MAVRAVARRLLGRGLLLHGFLLLSELETLLLHGLNLSKLG
jgi:hypothetical protein